VEFVGIQAIHEGQVQSYSQVVDPPGHPDGAAVGGHVQVGPTGDHENRGGEDDEVEKPVG
jgi:hypothetical protein